MERSMVRALIRSMLGWLRYRGLFFLLLKREIQAEYRATFFGGLWPILTPLLNLVVYSIVFGAILSSPWPLPEGVTKAPPFSLILWIGLVPFGILAEVFNMSPGEILRKPSYVKKIVFPLELLPAVRVGVAWFHGGVGLLLLLVATILGYHAVYWTWLGILMIAIPLLFTTLGIAWFFASLGVYFRDLANMTQVLAQLWFFATPIVYPPQVLPQQFAFVERYNLLAFVVSSLRSVVLWNRLFSLKTWLLWVVISGLFAAAAFVWFEYTKRGFADVL